MYVLYVQVLLCLNKKIYVKSVFLWYFVKEFDLEEKSVSCLSSFHHIYGFTMQ